MPKSKIVHRKYKDYVYDISLDGTFVNANGMNVMSNTDGINFKVPDKLRYTKEHPYISDGKGRNSIKGKAYIGVEADVREFEDIYLTGHNSIDIDEVIATSINFKRKNYANLLDNGDIRLVGNMSRSKTMPLYIERFIDKASRMLLENRGSEFIDYYYDYIEHIYSWRIPVRELATKVELKMSVEEYKKLHDNTLNPVKTRQACYELAISNNMDLNKGDEVYIVNTGTGKGDPDMKCDVRYISSDGADVTNRYMAEYRELKKVFKLGTDNKTLMECGFLFTDADDKTKLIGFHEYVSKKHPDAKAIETITLNCMLVPDVMMDEEYEGDEVIEYNVDRYIALFNSRVSHLFTCFCPFVNGLDKNISVADSIIVTNPDDRKSFAKEDCVFNMDSSDPRIYDVDAIEDVMIPDRKEVEFWKSVGKEPLFNDIIQNFDIQDVI